jgi:hypothetical protein
VTGSDATPRASIYSVAMKIPTGTAQRESVTDSTTIEVMLSPGQLRALATGSSATQQRKSRIIIGSAIAAVLVVLGSVAHLAAKQRPVVQVAAPAAKPTPAPSPVPAEQAAPAGEPVLFKNPFDRSEVFEFPPGTPQAEARDAVSKMLLERAQGRGPGVLKLRIRKAHNSTPAR